VDPLRPAITGGRIPGSSGDAVIGLINNDAIRGSGAEPTQIRLPLRLLAVLAETAARWNPQICELRRSICPTL
jgi:hypothetical protein